MTPLKHLYFRAQLFLVADTIGGIVCQFVGQLVCLSIGLPPVHGDQVDAGSQYCCGQVGRGSQPPFTPNAPPNPFSIQTLTQKAFKALVFPLFD